MLEPKGLIDFHCHLDLYEDHKVAVADAESAGVFTLAVTTTPRAWPRNLELTEGTRYVRAALGLHPQLAVQIENEVGLWDAYLEQTRYVGEVGLDAGPRFYKSLGLQREIFEHVLRRCSAAGGKILSVHSVRAAPSVLDAIEANLSHGKGSVVLHWFSGTRAEIGRAVELGCYFSVNAEMLRSERGREMVAGIPIHRLLTETDGPFVKVGGRPAKPTDIAALVRMLSMRMRVEEGRLVAHLRSNLTALLSSGAGC